MVQLTAKAYVWCSSQHEPGVLAHFAAREPVVQQLGVQRVADGLQLQVAVGGRRRWQDGDTRVRWARSATLL